ncbi:protein-L-isoaspartate(D-aspartate) O-methyltransferase, partial [Alphaproteobacteria bacterium]|nr:protein-L-isoaspartate(D-aspartate) O-methyltransferase [Alphaproteobacteria bacterium]
MLDVKKIRLILELREAGISDAKILSAIEKIPREKFIPENFRNQAYDNLALPIGDSQTISQPFVVAKMTQLLEVEPNHKVLEIGTGSGYQSAVLSKLVRRVYTVERIKNLLLKAEKVFKELRISNIVCKYADGNFGWKEQIPFDRIIITAATSIISKEIGSQIHEGGVIVSPMIQNNKQMIVKYKKINNILESKFYDDVLFVPNLSGT